DQIAGGVFPAERTGRQIEREQVSVAAADVHDAVRDGRGRLDHVAGGVRPEELGRGGQRGGGNASEPRAPTKLAPLIGGCPPSRGGGLGGGGGRGLLRPERLDDHTGETAQTGEPQAPEGSWHHLIASGPAIKVRVAIA